MEDARARCQSIIHQLLRIIRELWRSYITRIVRKPYLYNPKLDVLYKHREKKPIKRVY